MGKTTQVMSLSVRPELIARLDEAAEQRGHGNRSKLACELFEDFADLDIRTHEALTVAADRRGVMVSELVEYLVDRFPLEDDSLKPIVLKVPVSVATDRQRLEGWLSQKTTALVNHLHPN